jgi:hypothetical protein
MTMDTIEVGKLKVVIRQDDDAQNPREEFDNVGTMVCWHRRYTLGDEQPTCSPDDYMFRMMYDREFDLKRKFIPEDIKKEHVEAYINKHYFILPLYLYDHSGITMSTGRFGCPWDSGEVGFIFADRECKEYGDMLVGLTAEVATYDSYLTGDVYGYDIEDQDGNVVDSCWGFYGYEHCKTEALHNAQAYA